MDHPASQTAERAAAVLVAAGMPRMPSRIMMALTASPDDGYTAAELAERLGVSAAAVSGGVRYLQSLHIIERLSRPGERIARYEIMHDGWHAMIVANAPVYLRIAGLLDTIADENPAAPASVARARDMAGFLRFLAERLPQLVDEWEQRDR